MITIAICRLRYIWIGRLFQQTYSSLPALIYSTLNADLFLFSEVVYSLNEAENRVRMG